MDGLSISIDRGRVHSLRHLEWTVGIAAAALVLLSIVMFMMNSTADNVSNLITTQNDAALKLWVNLDYYQHHRTTTEPADTTLPPGLFASLVEFSRANASIMKAVHRLSLVSIFSSASSLDEIAEHVRPTDGKRAPSGQKVYFDHLGVDPRTDATNITEQGMYQIELYQAIRDYAQDASSFHKEFLGALSVNAMPVFYALLGASLWAFRQACQRPDLQADHASPDRSSRFVMAAIAGIAISVMSTLLPADVLLSPLAIAFVFGYSIEIFTSRLDTYIAGLAKHGQSSA